METKFTKAPWAWQKFGDKYMLTAQHGMREIILSANNRGTLVMNQDGILKPLDPNHPNARLAAASPEMFEAISAMIRIRDIYMPNDINEVEPEHYDEMNVLFKAFEQMQQAIKKATPEN